MPRGVAPRALLGMFALIITIALAFVPLVDARPKDKQNGKRDNVTEESVAPAEPAEAEAPPAEIVPPVEQPLTVETSNNGDERTLLSSDADGDYIPDALDNCPGAQNPDQADADGDGHGDVCAVFQDTDGDTVPDKSDNCPNIATSDFSDNDGDGVGNPCDKSPDGIEPTPEPVPELNGRGGEGGDEPPAPENGENQDGQSIERDSRSRSKQRERTDVEKATITTGVDDAAGVEAPPAEEQYEEPVRDNPRRNEELIAEAAASGELYAPPEPPPPAQRAWDEPEEGGVEWESVIRIDAGAIDGAEVASAADVEQNDARSRERRDSNAAGAEGEARDGEVQDSEFARGWVRAKLLLQEEAESDPGDGEVVADGQSADAPAPVPVESGLVITGVEDEPPVRAIEEPGEVPPAREEPLDGGNREARDTREGNDRDRKDNQRSSNQDGSRRDGSSRGRAAPDQRSQRERGNAGRDRDNQNRGRPDDWNEDRYFDGGAALNWSAAIDVAGTDDDGLYLTQRSGSGAGKKRGFGYAIPVDGDGVYLVRLYFAEPYWGAPGGPDGEEGQRVFTVAAEGETIVRDLDIFAEVGSMTALVKQVEVTVEDGELNLRFTADDGEPIIAAIEVLQPAS